MKINKDKLHLCCGHRPTEISPSQANGVISVLYGDTLLLIGWIAHWPGDHQMMWRNREGVDTPIPPEADLFDWIADQEIYI